MQKFVKLIIVVLIFAVVILAAPFGMGILAEKEAFKKIKEVQVKLAQYPNVEYKLVSYKRGFFKSKAEEIIIFKNLKINGKEIGPVEINLKDEIKHGPIVLSKNVKGKLDLWIGRAVVKSRLNKVVNLVIQPLPMNLYMGYIGFSGDIKLVLDIGKFSLDFPTFLVALEGLKDELEVSHDRKKINNQLELKHLAITSKIKPQKVNLTGLVVISDMEKDDKGLWLGSRKIEVDTLNAAVDGKNYVLKGLYNKNKDLEHDKQIKSEVMLNIRSAGVDNKLFGPHHLLLEMDGMDASIWGRLNIAFMKLGHGNLNQVGSTAQEQSPEFLKHQMLVNKIGDLTADLIKKGFLIEIKRLEIATNWGPLTANSSFKIPNLTDQQQQIPQLSLLTSILSMDSTFSARMPAGLAKAIVEARYRRMLEAQNLPTQTPDTQNISDLADKHLAKLVADGWLIPKDKEYEINLSFKKGQFLVNNKSLKPQGILPEYTPPAPPAVPENNNPEANVSTPSATENSGDEKPSSETQTSNKQTLETQTPKDNNDNNQSTHSEETVIKNPVSPVTPVPSAVPTRAPAQSQDNQAPIPQDAGIK